jgi:hypothetical protein
VKMNYNDEKRESKDGVLAHVQEGTGATANVTGAQAKTVHNVRFLCMAHSRTTLTLSRPSCLPRFRSRRSTHGAEHRSISFVSASPLFKWPNANPDTKFLFSSPFAVHAQMDMTVSFVHYGIRLLRRVRSSIRKALERGRD